MSDREPIDEITWAAWVGYMAAALEVDASGASPHVVHDLVDQAAACYQHLTASAPAYLRGLAIATYPDRGPGELARVILDALSGS